MGLALAGGGYEVGARHLAGLAVWLVVVALLVFGAASTAALGRPLHWTIGLIGAVAVWSAMSSLWSGSVELSLIEADRVLAYLGVFLAAFLIAQTAERRQRFAEGLALALAFVAILGLASRLLPDLLAVGTVGDGARLHYPLGYWNANGAAFGIAVAMLLWGSRHAGSAALRRLSAAAIPAVLLALYFTYSRGGFVVLAIAAGTTIALSRDRLWLLGTLAIGVLGALPAVLAVQSRRSLADNLADGALAGQGLTVLLVLAAGTALALLLFVGLRRLEGRGGRVTGRALEWSRNPALLRGLAAAGAVLAIVAAIAVGGRAWDRFSDAELQFPAQSEARLSDLSGAGRHDFWRVALDAFGEQPLRGIGAGTYEFAWERSRSIDLPLHNAHSLYLEAFAELGAIGGVLVLALVGSVLWWAFSAWRLATPRQRDLHAVLFAALLAFAVAAGFDWLWEIAALGAIFFLCAGAAVAARCGQLPATVESRGGDDGRRWGVAAGGLALAWIAAIAMIGPLLVEREIEASQGAAAEGEIATAVAHAERARSIEPWAASPYVQLGLLAELQGDYRAAISHFGEAIEREDQNWQWYYLRARAERQAGARGAAATDLARARRLNPLAACLEVEGGCG